jgi:peptide/nickel transport system ATP-binding protein
MLYISHDLASVAGLCHRVAILQAGRVVETGPAGEIFTRPRESYTQRLVAAIPRLPAEAPAEAPSAAEQPAPGIRAA